MFNSGCSLRIYCVEDTCAYFNSKRGQNIGPGDHYSVHGDDVIDDMWLVHIFNWDPDLPKYMDEDSEEDLDGF